MQRVIKGGSAMIKIKPFHNTFYIYLYLNNYIYIYGVLIKDQTFSKYSICINSFDPYKNSVR